MDVVGMVQLNKEKTYDSGIGYIRLISLSFIFICHIFQFYENELAWWFNIGVQLFFVISGFLYGNKRIENYGLFYLRRTEKLLPQYYVFVFFVFFLGFFIPSRKQSLASLLKAVFLVGTLNGVENLWFVGYIFFCYLIIPFLSAINESTKNKNVLMRLLCLMIASFVYAIIGIVVHSYFRPDRVLCFVFGYFVSSFYCDYGNSVWSWLKKVLIPLCLVANGLRIFLKYFSPEIISIPKKAEVFFRLYEYYCHMLLGIAIFIVLYSAIKWKKIKLLDYVDIYSYEFFLVHQLFILGPLSVMQITDVPLFNAMIALSLSVLSAVFLHSIGSFVKSRYGIKRI